MHRLVATTFKLLALSMLLMFTLDTSLILIEVFSVHSKVTNVMSIIQTEVARNNCLPYGIGEKYDTYIKNTLAGSGTQTNSRILTKNDIHTNFENTIVINGKRYEALTPENAGEYGDFLDVGVQVTIHPAYVYFNLKRQEDITWLKRGEDMGINLMYTYQVPCLRYLK